MTPAQFWGPVVTHPDVEPMVLAGLATLDEFLDWLEDPRVHEERYEGGGLVFVDKEEGQEVHVAFHPNYWGRNVALAFRDCFSRKMKEVDVVFAGEQEGYWRSRPPISHGWQVLEDFMPSVLPRRTRRWMLTRDAWNNSPVGRKTA